MLVCDVSAIDRLIDMYGENLSVSYKAKTYLLYDLRDEFVDNNMSCSLFEHDAISEGIRHKNGMMIIAVNPFQKHKRDDIITL